MVTIESIRKMYLREGRPIREISRTLGVSRQSVRKVIRGEVKRSYTISEPRACPVMDPYRELILAWLKDDEEAPPKQRLFRSRRDADPPHLEICYLVSASPGAPQ